MGAVGTLSAAEWLSGGKGPSHPILCDLLCQTRADRRKRAANLVYPGHSHRETPMRLARTSICLAAALAASCAAAPPALQVMPTTALVDDPIGILASGLTPSSEFAIRATTVDQRQRPWVAEARFVAGQDGAADLSDIAPLPGSSYEGVDQMGLFSSATPSSEGAAIAHRPGVVYTTTLEFVVDAQRPVGLARSAFPKEPSSGWHSPPATPGSKRW